MNKLIAVFFFCLGCCSASAQLLNADFENWYVDGAGHNRLNDWTHLDFGIPNSGFMATWEVSDAAHGAHALKLSRWYSYRSDWVMQKASVMAKPGMVTGQYKYTDNILMSPYNTDTAIVSTWLTVWNTTTLKCDTVGAGKALLTGVPGFTTFICPITYTDARTPDSIIVFIRPSVWYNNGVFCDVSIGNCSQLTIDHLELAEPSLTTTTGSPQRVSAIVSSSGILTLSAAHNITEVLICNTLGQQMLRGQYNNSKIQINIAHLPAGVYVVTAIDDRGSKSVQRILKQ